MSLELGHPIKHHLFRIKYTELNEIYYFMSLRSFALSLVMIFIPVYLYSTGYGVQNFFLYYLYMYLFEVFFEYFAARSIKIIGPKHSMIISLPFMIFHLWQLFSLGQIHWSPILLAIPSSIALAFFWEGYHYDFSRAKHRANTTKEVARLYITLTIIGALAPFFGGIIAATLGMNALLLTVIVIFSLASLILLKTKDTNFRKNDFKLSKVKLGKIKKDLISYAGLGWGTVSAMQIWPLFLFLIAVSYAEIGLITSLTIVATVFITYWVSKKADKNGRVGFIKIGGLLTAFVGLLQIFVDTILQAFAVNMGRSISESIYRSSFDSEYYLHADEEARSEYIYLMESTVDLSRMTFYVIMFVLSLFFTLKTVLIVGLIMGAFGSALIPIIPPADCEICGPIGNKDIKLTPHPKKS